MNQINLCFNHVRKGTIRLLHLVMFLIVITKSNAQQYELKNFLSKQQVADLRSTLHKKIPDTTRIRLLLRFAKDYFETGANEKVFLDSAALCIYNAKEISSRQNSVEQRGLVLLYEASLTRRTGNKDSGRLLVQQAIRQLRNANDKFHLAEAYFELSRCYDSHDPHQTPAIKKVLDTLFSLVPTGIPRNQQDSCMSVLKNFYYFQMLSDNQDIQLYYLRRLAGGYQILNDRANVLWARREQGNMHYKQGHLNAAIEELLQIAREQKEGGYPGICFTYDLLSGFYFTAANYNKSLYYGLEAIKNIKTKFDSAYLPNFYNRLSSSYNVTGSLEDAANCQFKALNYRIGQKQFEMIYGEIYKLTLALVKLNRASEAIDIINANRNNHPPLSKLAKNFMLMSLVESYRALHKYQEAEPYCDELIRLYELRVKEAGITGDMTMHQLLAYFYLDAGKYQKAEKYFKITLSEWPKSSKDVGIIYQHFFLFKLDSVRGNYISAIKHLKKYQLIKDSMQTAAKAKQIEEIKVAYQTEQKDSLINLKEQNIQLLTKQDQLQKSKLQQGTLIRNISFSVLALLIIVMALLFNRYKLKQRTNKKLESNQAEIAKQNISLQQLVNEKDWLVKEIHHRVKNNLQMVVSLLNAQTEFLTHPSALDAIKESRERMQAITIVHQKLYQLDNSTQINMRSYINELIDNIKNSFVHNERIHFKVDITDINLDISQSVPLGLILNEAITNAVKYAFPKKENGLIRVSLKHNNTDKLQLKIADNGEGLPASINIDQSNTLGLQLIKLFSEQLDGELYFINNNGLEIILSFKTIEYNGVTLDKAIA